MPTPSVFRAVTAGVMLLAPLCFATGTPRSTLLDGLRPNATCSCGSAADCTCKKGSCKCPKCGHDKKGLRIFEALKPVDSKLPDTARRDATAGVFI